MASSPDTKQRLIELSTGVFVESDVWRVVEKIREYDPNLRIKFLNSPAQLGEAPYAVFERCPDGIERKVFDIWELNDKVLERLYAADTMKHDVLAKVDAANAAARRELKNRYEDSMGEANDIVEHVLRSSKGQYSFKKEDGSLVKIDDDPMRRTVVEPRRD